MLYLYVYPYEYICKKYLSCGKEKEIRRGWAEEMKKWCGRICTIFRECTIDSDDPYQVFHLTEDNGMYKWSVQLGMLFEVESKCLPGYPYLCKHQEKGYVITSTWTNECVGSIMNLPDRFYKPKKKTSNNVLNQILKKRRNADGNLALSHRA